MWFFVIFPLLRIGALRNYSTDTYLESGVDNKGHTRDLTKVTVMPKLRSSESGVVRASMVFFLRVRILEFPGFCDIVLAIFSVLDVRGTTSYRMHLGNRFRCSQKKAHLYVIANVAKFRRPRVLLLEPEETKGSAARFRISERCGHL